MAKAVYGLRAAARSGPTYRATSQTFQTAEDIIPIAELKANMSEIVRGLDERPRPLVVTLNGKPAAVVMSPREYDRLSYEARFVGAVNEGLAAADAGLTEDAEGMFADILQEPRAKPRRVAKSR